MTPQRQVAAALALMMTLGTTPALMADDDEPTEVVPGSRVRIATSKDQPKSERLVGELISVEPGRLLVRPLGPGASTLDVPLASITRFELYEGRSRRSGRGAVIGMTAGALTGVGLGLMACQDDACGHGDIAPAADEVAWFAGLIGLGLGAALGSIVGSTIKGDDWDSVSPPRPRPRPRVMIAPQKGGVRVAMTFRF